MASSWNWVNCFILQKADRPRPRVSAACLHEQWANCPCGLMYRSIFFFTNSCEPELAHRLQTSKMRRTLLDSCQHDDIDIVTVSIARRRWTAPLKPRRPRVKHFTTFYALLKHVSPKGDYFTPKGHFFCTLGPLFCTLVREEAIFAVCKRCANEGFACMCKEKTFSIRQRFFHYLRVFSSWAESFFSIVMFSARAKTFFNSTEVFFRNSEEFFLVSQSFCSI